MIKLKHNGVEFECSTVAEAAALTLLLTATPVKKESKYACIENLTVGESITIDYISVEKLSNACWVIKSKTGREYKVKTTEFGVKVTRKM